MSYDVDGHTLYQKQLRTDDLLLQHIVVELVVQHEVDWMETVAIPSSSVVCSENVATAFPVHHVDNASIAHQQATTNESSSESSSTESCACVTCENKTERRSHNNLQIRKRLVARNESNR